LLCPERLRLWAIAGVAVNLGILIVGSVRGGGVWFIGSDGYPLPYDFLFFRAAAIMAERGDAALAYDWAQFQATVRDLLGGREHLIWWPYPPNFFAYLLPLAWLPYPLAFTTWLVITGAIHVAGMRAALPVRGVVFAALGAPAALFTAQQGQASFLTVGLLSLSLAMLDRRPWLAGVLLGLVSYKPNLGLVLPVFLLVGGYWRSVLGAALTVVGLMLVSGLLVGFDAWYAYMRVAPGNIDFVLSPWDVDPTHLQWTHLQSIYALVFAFTGDVWTATLVHGTVAGLAVLTTAWLWYRQASTGIRSSAALASSVIVTPYLFGYDTLLLAAAGAFFLNDCLTRGFQPGDRIVICLAWILPAGAALHVVMGTTSGFTPAAALLLLAFVVRRAAVTGSPSPPRHGLALEAVHSRDAEHRNVQGRAHRNNRTASDLVAARVSKIGTAVACVAADAGCACSDQYGPAFGTAEADSRTGAR